MPVPASQQITLEMILKAQDNASTAIKAVGAELAAVGKNTKIGDLSVGLRESLNAVNAELRTAAGERVQLAKQVAAEELNAARSERGRMVREAKEHFAELAKLADEAAAKERARAQADAQKTLAAAVWEHQKQTQEAKEWLAKETALLAKAAEDRAKLLGGLSLASWKGGTSTPRWRDASGRYAKSTLAPDDQRTVAAEIQADEALAKAHQATYATMVGDAHKAYRAITKVTEEGLEQQLSAQESGLTKQRTLLDQNRRIELEGIEELYQGWVSITKGGLAHVQNTTASSLQKDLEEQRAYASAVISEAKRMQKEQEAAAKASATAQNAVAKATQDTARAASASVGPLERVTQSSERALEHFANFGKQLLIWNLGYAAVGKVTQGIGELASSLVTVNADLEKYTATFSSIYQNADKGKAAVAWLTDFAVKVPATREETIQAGLAIASLGDDVTQVMKPLSNVAAVMGVDLPRAAQAFADAQEGRFEMLKTTLHVTKEELVHFGLQLDASGHVLNNSFVPAFEELGKVRFGKAAEDQMNTLYGALSNVKDAFTNLEQIAGRGVFNVLKGHLAGLITMLGSTGVERWALGIGNALGHALEGAISFTKWMAHNFGPPVMAVLNAMVALWQAAAPLIAGAAHVVQEAIGGIATFFQGSVLPVMQYCIDQMKTWWDAHVKDVGVIWNNLGSAIQKFWDYLGKTGHTVMMELQGYWTIVWGVLSGVVGIAIDVMSGDWKRARTDFLGIWKSIELGVLQIVNGLVDQVIHAFVLMAGPIAQALNAVFKPAFQAVVSLGVELFMFLALKVEQVFARIAGNVHGVVKTMTMAMSPLLGLLPGGNLVADSLNKTVDRLQGGKDDSVATLIAKARAAGAGAGADVGAVLGTGPLPSLSISEKQEKAITHTVDTFFAGLEKSIDKTMTTGAMAGGEDWWTKLQTYMKKHGIVLPTLPKTTPVGTPDLSLPGYSTTTAGEQAKAARQQVRDAQDRFQLLLDSGKATWSAGIADINAIMKEEKTGGASPVQMQLDALRDTKTLVTNLLDQARKQFDFDAGVAHPSRVQMQKDEAAVLAILSKTPGLTAIDYKSAKAQLDDAITAAIKKTGQSAQDVLAKAQQDLKYEETLKMPYKTLKAQVDTIMADLVKTGVKPGSLEYRATYKQLMDEIGKQTGTTGTGGVSVPTPLYGPYRITAPQYGATQASFGGAAQQNSMATLISHLQSLVSYWSARARRDEDALRAQQQTAANTMAVAQNTQSLPERLAKAAAGLGLAPEPSNAGAASRARGGFAPMRRN